MKDSIIQHLTELVSCPDLYLYSFIHDRSWPDFNYSKGFMGPSFDHLEVAICKNGEGWEISWYTMALGRQRGLGLLQLTNLPMISLKSTKWAVLTLTFKHYSFKSLETIWYQDSTQNPLPPPHVSDYDDYACLGLLPARCEDSLIATVRHTSKNTNNLQYKLNLLLRWHLYTRQLLKVMWTPYNAFLTKELTSTSKMMMG